MSANIYFSCFLLNLSRYCKRVYQPNTDTSAIFLVLLKLYLQPTIKTPNLLQPALDLISRQNHRLDPVKTLQLLPPLVSAQDVRAFLQQVLRSPVFDSHVVREVNKAWSEQVARKLMILESRRVKVTDSRMYAIIRFLFYMSFNHMMYPQMSSVSQTAGKQCHRGTCSTVGLCRGDHYSVFVKCSYRIRTTSAEKHFPRSSTCYDK